MCNVCGRWAGFFRKVHDSCLDIPPSVLPSKPVHQGGNLVLTVGSSDLPRIKTLLTDGSMLGKVQADGSMKAANITSISVRPKITGKNASRIIASVPQLQGVVGRELRRAHITDVWCIAAVTAKLLDNATLASTESGFVKWCRSEDAPVDIKGIEKARLEALFWAAFALDNAAKHIERMFGDDLEDTFPFFKIESYACRLHADGALDGFTALRDDKIWECLWPPNGWLCSCTVLSLLLGDVEDESLARSPGIERVGSVAAFDATSWHLKSPRSSIKIVSS